MLVNLPVGFSTVSFLYGEVLLDRTSNTTSDKFLRLFYGVIIEPPNFLLSNLRLARFKFELVFDF